MAGLKDLSSSRSACCYIITANRKNQLSYSFLCSNTVCLLWEVKTNVPGKVLAEFYSDLPMLLSKLNKRANGCSFSFRWEKSAPKKEGFWDRISESRRLRSNHSCVFITSFKMSWKQQKHTKHSWEGSRRVKISESDPLLRPARSRRWGLIAFKACLKLPLPPSG